MFLVVLFVDKSKQSIIRISWVLSSEKKASNTNQNITNPFNIRLHSVLHSKRQPSQINFKLIWTEGDNFVS